MSNHEDPVLDVPTKTIKQVPTSAIIREHPALKYAAPLSGRDFESFKARISALGIEEPLRVCGDMLVAGRNRLRAARELGFTHVPVIEVSEEKAGDIALDLDFARRYSTDAQRAVAAARFQADHPAPRGGDRRSPSAQRNDSSDVGDGHRARHEAAARFNVAESAVRKAAQLVKEAPELADEVFLGRLKLGEARRRLRGGGEGEPTRDPTPRVITKRSQVPAPRTTRAPAPPSTRQDSAERDFREELRALAEQIVKAQKLPMPESDTCFRALWSDLDTAFKSFLARSKRVLAREEDRAKARTSSELTSACSVFGIDRPGPGELLDADTLHRRKRELMKTCHPDQHDGPEANEKSQGINEAFAVLMKHTAPAEVFDSGSTERSQNVPA